MGKGTDTPAAISSIRHFNRYYTNRLGLLSRYRFDTRLTLTEARVILEIGRRGEHTQSGLRADLKIDGGYLNRVVGRLAGEGLLQTSTDASDRRVRTIALSARGRAVLAEVESSSDAEAASLMAGLSPEDAAALVGHLRAVERLLEGRAGSRPVVEPVRSGRAVATVRVLISEYAAFLGQDLSFQHFQEELAGLPGSYAPPGGALFLASVGTAAGGSEPAGCVAVRHLAEGTCEMKRLFVRPEYRGFGVGRALAERALAAGRELGYRRMRLDTLAVLNDAVALYKVLGFRRIRPYYHNPLPGAQFWEKRLDEPGAPSTGSRARPSPGGSR
jgi:putative acetyltransferase